jgi:ubiquitin carboxyl-terminal hydrolase MINDY-3/4
MFQLLQDKTLVGEESNEALARRVFASFDKEGRGFITIDSLGPLMKQLNLVSMAEYVKIMAEKLDPEQLGVITLNSFLEEFYSNDKPNHDAVQTFIVYHYNGLPRSSLNNKVQYSEAKCAIMDMPEVQMISDFSQIKSCLLTKWPTIELTWKNDSIPSLN